MSATLVSTSCQKIKQMIHIDRLGYAYCVQCAFLKNPDLTLSDLHHEDEDQFCDSCAKPLIQSVVTIDGLATIEFFSCKVF